MVTVREKGKIPKQEWPNIVARYNGGDTVAQIGRDYGCTAPAIRYIIKRSGALKGNKSEGTALSGRQAGRAEPRPFAAESAPFVRREGGLSAEQRKRVTGDVAAFLVALDQAMIDPSQQSVVTLQEATDRLMRSTARVRLDLERLLDAHQEASLRARGAREPAEGPQRA